MRPSRWRITGNLTTTAPLHIGSGDVTTCNHRSLKHENDKGKEELNDIQAVVRDHIGKPCIPGTALKGVLRSWAERMLPSSESASLDRIFGSREIEKKGTESGWAEFCTAYANVPDESALDHFAERVPYWSGHALPTSGHSAEQSTEAVPRCLLTGVLSHVSIDRFTGAAAHNKLFYEEFVPEGVTFDVEIDATRLTEHEITLLLAILEQGAAHATHPYQFGANGADGWGTMCWKLTAVESCAAPQLAAGKVGFDCCTTKQSLTSAAITPQFPPHVSVDLALAIKGPFLVNDASRGKPDGLTEEQKRAYTDFNPLRRADGGLWLPASSLRGALRERSEFLLRSLNPNATGDPGNPPGDGPIERLFGTTSRAARLRFTEPKEVKNEAGNFSEARKQDFVAIDRFTGGAAEGAKFDATYADSPKFTTRLVLDVNGLKPEDVALLRVALDDVCRGKVPIGFGGAKGYGEVEGQLSGNVIYGFDPGWNVRPSLFGKSLDQEGFAWIGSHLPNRSLDALQAQNRPVFEVPAIKVLSGKLSVQQTKRGWDYPLSYTDEKGKSKSVKVHENQIHESLRGKSASAVEVDFEMENGKQVRIWPKGQPRGANAISPPMNPKDGEFAHPYYFLRMADREKLAGDLKYSQPIGHCRWQAGLFSGKLRVRLTVETPLLICDDRNRIEDSNYKDHFIYSVRKGQDGKPDLASSSVRGMLRSAYEAITNSRFGVFPSKPDKEKNGEKANARHLGYRMNAGDGLSLVPVRIENEQATLMMGKTTGLPKYDSEKKRWKVLGDLYAAWVPQYQKNVAGYSSGAIKIGGNPPTHGQAAWCWLERMKHNRIPFTFWRVREAADSESKLSTVEPQPTSTTSNYTSCNEFLKAQGFFVISNQNIKNKHDERFFFGHEQSVDLSSDVVTRYRNLIADCQELHADELEERAKKSPPESPTLYTPSVEKNGKVEKAEIAAMSRHTYDSAALDAGRRATFCYAFAKMAGNTCVIEALYPVTISRKLYDKSPLDLLPESLRPALSIEQLSPADRVFGWVNQDKVQAQGEACAAYRSQLRVGPVTCQTDAGKAITEFPEPKTLAILGQPKPQQGRFYLGDKDGKAQQAGRTKEQAGYTEGNRIRGPKVYPHHANWDNAQPQKEKSNQNRSITGWVNPGTEFGFDLHITNVSAVELGALVWLLSLPEEHYLRLGLGKPLGFGSVRVEIDTEQTLVADGAEWITSLVTPNHTVHPADLSHLQQQFEAAINVANPELLAAFKLAARGFGNAPIHYPLTTDQSSGDGETYKWFVANEQDGRGHVLPDLIPGPFLVKH